jgi:hypothetical protein
MRGLRLVLVALSVVALGAWGCASDDGGGAAGAMSGGVGGVGGAGGMGGVGGGAGIGGAAGMAVAGMGGAGGMGGTGGTGGVVGMTGGTGGAGGMMGGAGGMMGGAGGMGGADPTMCSAGYKCQTIGAQMLCAEEATSQPPMCTMGGTECAALTGSVCTMIPGLGERCLKTCGTPMMMGCPMGLTCVNPLNIQAICSPDGFFPPTCTMGGNECAQYGTACAMVSGVMGCLIPCTM